MDHFRRTPLAWKNLSHNPRRLLVAVSGVMFAVVLMFMERGFRSALFDSTVELVRNFAADIVMVSSSRYSLSTSSRFPLDTVSLARLPLRPGSLSDLHRELHVAAAQTQLSQSADPRRGVQCP